jgi:hypothetical protein
LNLSLLAMMFGKEFLHQVCLFATIFFPYSLPIEIKETSVRFHVFVFSKGGTMVCAFAKNGSKKKVSKKALQMYFHSNMGLVCYYFL